MNRKVQILSEIASRTTSQLTGDKASWRHFLTMAARLYDTGFTDAALIYAHHPNAATCRDADQWAAQGRRVNRSAKAIPLIDTGFDSPSIRYVYDISQTTGTAPQPEPWRLAKEHIPHLITHMQTKYGAVSGKGDYRDIKATIEAHTYFACERYLDGIEQEAYRDPGALREAFTETVIDSVGYLVSARCGLPQGLYNDDAKSFLHLHRFQSSALITRMGTAIHEIAKDILQDIERTVIALEKQMERSIQNDEGNQQYELGRTQSGSIHDTGGNTEHGAGRNTGNREIRQDGDGLHENDRSGAAESPDSVRPAPGDIHGSGQGGVQSDGRDRSAVAQPEAPPDERGLSGIGSVREPDTQHSGGNRTNRNRIPTAVITEYPQTAAGNDENPAAVSFPEHDGQLALGALPQREQTGEEKETPQPDPGRKPSASNTLPDGDKVIQAIINGTHNEQLRMEEPEKTAEESPVSTPQAQEIPPDYVPAYRTGDTVYLENDREFAIAAIRDSEIMLADASFPLLNRSLEPEQFERLLRQNPKNAVLFQPEQSGEYSYKRGDTVYVDGETARVITRITDTGITVANNMQSAYPKEYNREDFEKRLAANPKNNDLLTERPAQAEPEDAPAASKPVVTINSILSMHLPQIITFVRQDETLWAQLDGAELTDNAINQQTRNAIAASIQRCLNGLSGEHSDDLKRLHSDSYDIRRRLVLDVHKQLAEDYEREKAAAQGKEENTEPDVSDQDNALSDDLFLVHYPIMLRKLMGEQDYLEARADYKDTEKARAVMTKTLDRLITEAGQETPALQFAYKNDPAFNKRLSDQLFKDSFLHTQRELQKIDNIGKKKTNLSREARNCRTFYKLFPLIADETYRYMKLQAGDSFDPLHVERIGDDVYAVSHTYIQNGDVMRDPEMTFRLDREKGTLEPLTFENSGMGIYQRVYPEEGKWIPQLRGELLSFTVQWFKNITKQGYIPEHAVMVRDGEDITIMFDKEGNPIFTPPEDEQPKEDTAPVAPPSPVPVLSSDKRGEIEQFAADYYHFAHRAYNNGLPPLPQKDVDISVSEIVNTIQQGDSAGIREFLVAAIKNTAYPEQATALVEWLDEIAQQARNNEITHFDTQGKPEPEEPENTDDLPGEKEYELGFGYMGNGITVWNRLEERNGDYVTVAHIDPDRTVTIYDKDMPEEVRSDIEKVARTSTNEAFHIPPLEDAPAKEEPAKLNYGASDNVFLNDRRYSIDRISKGRVFLLTYEPLENTVIEESMSVRIFERVVREHADDNEHLFVSYQTAFLDRLQSVIREKEEPQPTAAETIPPETEPTGKENDYPFPVPIPLTIYEWDRIGAGYKHDKPDGGKSVMLNLNGIEEIPVVIDNENGLEVQNFVFWHDNQFKNTHAYTINHAKFLLEKNGIGMDEMSGLTGYPFMRITQREWDSIAEDYKSIRPNGYRQFARGTVNGTTLEPVIIDNDDGLERQVFTYRIHGQLGSVRAYTVEEALQNINHDIEDIQDLQGVSTHDFDEESYWKQYWEEGITPHEPGNTALPENREAAAKPGKGMETDPQQRHGNYHFSEADGIGMGGQKTKFRQNVAAIQLLQSLEKDSAAATPEQQSVLAKYAGWGGIPQAFDPGNEKWRREYQELKELLSDEEYQAARASTLNAHYTSPTVIDAVYTGLRRLGYQGGGNVLEPALGVGNFFACMPEDMRDSKLYGVELDSVTGRIAKKLYPDANIQVQGFERTAFPENCMDVVIGNIPFGSFGVADPKYDKHNFLIHDYFLAKSLDTVRPGGIVALITSSGTMDKENTKLRQYLAEQANLLGAIRLPDTAFKANANTEVTTDILFLQKKTEQTRTGEENKFFGQNKLPGSDGIFVNEYFALHPDMMLGEMRKGNKLYGSEDSTTLADDGRDLKAALQEAVAKLPYNVMTERETSLDIYEGITPADLSIRNYCYALIDGEVYQRENDRMVKKDFTGKPLQRVTGMIELRDQVRHIINIQMAGCGDSELAAEQEKLNRIYDAYTAKLDIINSAGNRNAFRDDSDYPLISSLEILDDNGKFKEKAAIFTQRTVRPVVPVNHCETAQEALAVSLNEKGMLDLGLILQLTGKPLADVTKELHGQIFKDPQLADDEMELAGWVTADEYLSGNVREKLGAAIVAARDNPFYQFNVDKLEEVQPQWLKAGDIRVELRANWIDEDIVRQFIVETLKPSEWEAKKISVRYSPNLSTWFVSGTPSVGENDIEAYSTFGTKRVNGYRLVDSLLNQRSIKVYDTRKISGSERRFLNHDETIAARDKAEQLQAAFRNWVFDDPDRREYLVNKYNRLFNSTRLRKFNGDFLTFPGMNPAMKLDKHQLDAVAHNVFSGKHSLNNHGVGAGKTITGVATAMTAKRLGLSNKPCFCVPKHLTMQWANEFMRLYPSAKILVATDKDFEKDKRKRFVSRIATGNYDGIIIGHSSFGKIPMSERKRREQLQDEIYTVMDAIEEAMSDDSKGHGMVKQLEGKKKRLEAKLEKLTSGEKKDTLLSFEELGVDLLFVDESQAFKNLYIHTSMGNVAGIPQAASQKASDMYMKTQYLNEKNNGRGVVFLTATPVSNTIAELFTLFRYLCPDRLKELGIENFDAWAATFGETITAMELAPDGTGYRAKERFCRFFNVPELLKIYHDFSDIQTPEMLNLPVPEVEYHTEVCPPSPELLDYIQELAELSEKVRKGDVDPCVANMLTITNDGRKAALDIRLTVPDAPDYEDSKVNRCVDNVYRIWNETGEKKSTQMVFCDLSTPKPIEMKRNEQDVWEVDTPSQSVYADIKSKLIEKGIPPNQVAFIHDAKTDKQKDALFAKVRNGEVRVLIGSTEKMGAGTNVQNKMIAAHHLDCPWRPTDITQREGRAKRQGNENGLIQIYRYVTERSFDAYSWQILENKQKFLDQLNRVDGVPRTIEDVDVAALNYAEVKALATGDPRIIRKAEVDAEVIRLETLERQYRFNRYGLEDNIKKKYPAEIAVIQEKLDKLQRDKEWRDQHKTEGFSITLSGTAYTDRKEAAKALVKLVKAAPVDEKTQLGTYLGFPITLYRERVIDQSQLNLLEDMPEPEKIHNYLSMRRELTYPIKYTSEVSETIDRIESPISKMEKHLATFQSDIDKYKGQIAAFQTEYDKPFAYKDQLMELKVEQQELNLALNLDKKVDAIVADSEDEEAEAPEIAYIEDEDEMEMD